MTPDEAGQPWPCCCAILLQYMYVQYWVHVPYRMFPFAVSVKRLCFNYKCSSGLRESRHAAAAATAGIPRGIRYLTCVTSTLIERSTLWALHTFRSIVQMRSLN